VWVLGEVKFCIVMIGQKLKLSGLGTAEVLS
jgi:hypothetical protein